METKAKISHKKRDRKLVKHQQHKRGPWVKPAFVVEYEEQFVRHYPSYRVDTKPRRQIDGETKYAVAINGSIDGAVLMNEWDVREATRAFRA